MSLWMELFMFDLSLWNQYSTQKISFELAHAFHWGGTFVFIPLQCVHPSPRVLAESTVAPVCLAIAAQHPELSQPPWSRERQRRPQVLCLQFGTSFMAQRRLSGVRRAPSLQTGLVPLGQQQGKSAFFFTSPAGYFWVNLTVVES